MSSAIGSYLLAVVSAAILLNLVQSVLPKGTIQSIAGFVGGLLVILTVLSPITEADFASLSDTAMSFLPEAEEVQINGETGNRDLMAGIIKDRCWSYIWDKANELGAELEVEVILSEDGGYPYPVSVILKGSATPYQRSILTEYIALDMGIPAERQEWNIH